MLPSRLAATASSTMPPTSAFTPASSAERVKRFLPCSTTIGFSSGACSLLRSFCARLVGVEAADGHAGDA